MSSCSENVAYIELKTSESYDFEGKPLENVVDRFGVFFVCYCHPINLLLGYEPFQQ
jgi:hypothetical protein